MEIKVLDHGYVKLIDSMGTDETIVEAARMSTGKGFLDWDEAQECTRCGLRFKVQWTSGYACTNGGHSHGDHDWKKIPGDAKLLAFLYANKHMTPFEMCELAVEVQAPIFVFREWHRHRTQCLSSDTEVTFELPGRVKKAKHGPYKLTMRALWERWQPTERVSRQSRQENALWPRQRVQTMQLRCLNEDTGEFTTSRITDVIRSAPKPLYRLTTVSGKTVRASADHRFFTDCGWQRLGDMAKLPTETDSSWTADACVTVGITSRAKAQQWEPTPFAPEEEQWRPVLGWEDSYIVSNMGRLRRIRGGQGTRVSELRTGTPAKSGYLVISLSRGNRTFVRTVHSLVLEAFIGPKPADKEARHADHNRLNPRLSNLSWGSSAENSADMVAADRQQRLIAGHEQIACIAWSGVEETYDLSVEGPWHNFVAGGMVVHNSYNEFSARYEQMPDLHYLPTPERIQFQSNLNKQGSGESFDADDARDVVATFDNQQHEIYDHYAALVKVGCAKEVARINTPVSRYSKMRAKTDLRNWLGFLQLRMAPNAQWEIRQYANAVAEIVKSIWPRTYALFEEHDLHGVHLSRSEADAVRRIIAYGDSRMDTPAMESARKKIAKAVIL